MNSFLVLFPDLHSIRAYDSTPANTSMSSARRRRAIDLNRELPPLPALTPVQPLNIKKVERRTGGSELDRLPMESYNAFRDAPKYGGVHYFNDGRGKVFVPPPRISSASSSSGAQSTFPPPPSPPLPPSVPSLLATVAQLRTPMSMVRNSASSNTVLDANRRDSIPSNYEAFGAAPSDEGTAEEVRSQPQSLVYNLADANNWEIDEDDCLNERGNVTKKSRRPAIKTAEYSKGLSSDNNKSIKYTKNNTRDFGKEYKELIAEINLFDTVFDESLENSAIASTSARAEPSTSRPYQLKPLAHVEKSNYQHDFRTKANDTSRVGLGLNNIFYKSGPMENLNYPTSNKLSNIRNTYEFGPDTPPARVFTHFDSSHPGRTAATKLDFSTKFDPYTDLSNSAPDFTQRESARLTTWTDVQEMTGLVHTSDEHTKPRRARTEKKKAQGKVKNNYEANEMLAGEASEQALQPGKFKHMKEACSEDVSHLKGKRPEFIKAVQAHMSTSGSIEVNESSNLSSVKNSPVVEPGRYAYEIPSSTKKISSQYQEPGSYPNRSGFPKKLFGEGGMLNNSLDLGLEKSGGGGLLERIKRKTLDIGLKAGIFPAKKGCVAPKMTTTIPISLKENEQATVYAQVELILCEVSNSFLMEQYTHGCMLADSIKRMTDFWRSKGRAEVIEFKYDQLTQCDLIIANQKNFRFHGRESDNKIRINAILYTWKQDAKEMSVRTFCFPDSMIEKHLADSYKLLEILGGKPEQTNALILIHEYFSNKVNNAQDVGLRPNPQ